MRWCSLLAALLLLLQLSLNSGQSAGQCSAGRTCSDCIKKHYTCKWCKDKDYSGSARCQSNLSPDNAECTNWVFPESEIDKVEEDFDPIIQVKPTQVKIIKLRPGEERNISITVKSSRNYPLDVYYLMDFSYSMQGDLEELTRLTENIIENLSNVSSDYALGFGTFVDKPTSPYANTARDMIEHPCPGCQAVHSFNHEMKITGGEDDAKNILLNKLKSLQISSNVDNPEGGFDAMVQAAVCAPEIGWREVARRVIFFASDAVFHVAGDGKLAGIVEPNLGTCGMVNNKYAKSLEQDYPSIGQLNDILINNKVIPIFAVTDPMQSLYDELSEHLTQLSSVGLLSDNSGDVATLIKDQLEAIVSSTQLNPQAPPGVTVTVTPKCSGNQKLMDNKQGCSGVLVEENVEFSVVVKVDECKSETDADNKYSFNIEVPGIASVGVDIEMICQCECETDEGSIEKDSDSCENEGDLICGACQCHPGNYGENCECNQEKVVSNAQCKNPTTGSICGGENSGKCICGQCQCIQPSGGRDNYERWGQWCECSNYECPRNLDNEICSNNGECRCGICNCDKTPNGTPKQSTDPQYTGKDCGCPVSKATCFHPDTKLECSGPSNGECVCGECTCKPDHFGEFCDICTDCGPLNCTQYVECVTCMFDGKDKDDVTEDTCGCKPDKDANRDGSPKTSLSNDERVDTSKLGRHKQCTSIPIDENCDIIYYLHYKDKGTAAQPELLEILIDREPDCPKPPDTIAIVAGVIGGILAVGILLLALWKIYTSYVDKREYTKFLEERSKAKWNTGLSPLYKEPMTKYTNPLYTAAASRI